MMAQTRASLAAPIRSSQDGASRGVHVNDYVGQRASEVAQSVRRAGLKPALERTFGWGPEQIGLVVAQEPSPGAELARNSSVKLYVGAPGENDPEEGAPPAQAEEPAPHRADAVVDQAAGPRRRKVGLAHHETAEPSPPPPPWPPEPPREPEPHTEDLRRIDDPSPAQLAERAGEVFAERRALRGWRSRVAWPARARGWRHSRLAKVAAVVGVLWLAVGLASAFSSHGRGRSAGATVHRDGTPSLGEAKPAPASRTAEEKPHAEPPRADEPVRRHRHARNERSHARAGGARTARGERRKTARAVPSPSIIARSSLPASAEAPPIPIPQGGPFSP